ncbi:MAG: MATE family efflux transporter [Flavobacteriaceae bacterium]|nr:MATE family efflux transporter [Flavobacteriaceae bacterium]
MSFLQQYFKEFPYNFKLAFPVIIGMLGHTFVAFADNIMVGQLGTAELAAVSLGNSIIFIAMSFGIGFSTAITPLIAEADSSKNIEKGKSVLKHGLFLCSILSLVLFGLMLFAEPAMKLMKQPEEVVILAIPYLKMVAFSLIPLVIFQGLKQFSDGLSLTKYPMYATVIGNIVNVFLNYLFIFGKFGCPELGIIGAGIGTLASRFIMPFFLWFVLKKNSRTHYYFDFNWKILHKKALKELINLGVPSSLQMVFEVAIFTAAIWLSGVLGKNPQAANQIALNLSSMTFMVASGLGVAAMIRVGNYKGLNDFTNLRRITTSIFLLILITQSVFALFFAVFRDWLPTIYLDENDILNQLDNSIVIAKASKLLLIAAIFQISDGIQVVALGALKGLQDVKMPMIIVFIAYWFVGFPISYFLGLKTDLQGVGIWIGLLTGLTVAAVWLSLRFYRITKQN